ncbi:hypothetical protein OAX95_00360 [bacterium]|nr:hypothetical protein [bacterium]
MQPADGERLTPGRASAWGESRLVVGLTPESSKVDTETTEALGLRLIESLAEEPA